MSERRKLLIEFTEREKMYYYSLIEIFVRKFNQKRFDNWEQEWFNQRATTNQGTAVLY